MTSDVFEKPSSVVGGYEQVHSHGSRFGQDLVGVDVKKMITGGLASEMSKGATKFFQGLTDRLADIFDGKRPPGWEKVADAFKDGQLALTQRLDLLSPLLDYGSAYMDSKGGFLLFGDNHGTMPFVNQLGPMQGCELYDNGIRLLDAGLWDIRAQLAFGGNTLGVGAGKIEWLVRVYRPDGSLFSEQLGVEDNVWTKTSTIVSSVVVPEPGYVVKVEVAWIHGSRRLLGGPRNNRLTVQHISRRTDVGHTGSEDSYVEPTDPESSDEP